MEKFDLLGDQTHSRDVWRCAAVEPGALSVMTALESQMLKLFADSWGIAVQVCYTCEDYVNNSMYIQVPLHSAVLPMDKELVALCWTT